MSIGELRERLQSSESWRNDPLRIVPAPKSQRWRVREDVWGPVENRTTAAGLRPLAHVSLADQSAGVTYNSGGEAQGEARRRVEVGKKQYSEGTEAWTDGTAKAAVEFEPGSNDARQGRGLTAAERKRVEAIERNEILILPESLDQPFRELAERLTRISPPGAFVLGGGTVLAARYRHRDSTDLDVFCSMKTSERIDAEHGERVWIRHLEGWLGEHPERTIGAMTVVGTIGNVPFSVCPASGVLETGTPQAIHGHIIEAQTTHEILEGKILGRIIDEDTTNTIRDLYDMTVAARLEPRAMASALGKLGKWPIQMERVVKSLSETPSDLHRTDPRPIIEARYDLEFPNLAQRLIPMIESGDPAQAPQTRPSPSSEGINPGEDRKR